MDFNQMPEEVLEKILLYCPGRFIPEYILVSKRFNAVISHSVQLMKNFTVEWQKRPATDMRPLLESKRKYCSISISQISVLRPNLLNFVTNQASKLTSIFFNDCAFTTTEMKTLLSLVAVNIETLCFCEVNLEHDCAVEPIEMPKLSRIEMSEGQRDGFFSMIRFFNKANLKCFQYEDSFEVGTENLSKFVDFLSSQSRIRELSLSDNVVRKIFQDEIGTDWYKSMQLENVYLVCNDISPKTCDLIAAFLKHQKRSLKLLTLLRCTITTRLLEALLSLELEEIRLVHVTFNTRRAIKEVNTSIKKLFLSGIVIDDTNEFMICQLMEKCTSVRKLVFRYVEITFEMSVTMVHKMNLEVLDVMKCKLLPITYPKLQKLAIHNCEMRDVIRLIRMNWFLNKIIVSSVYQTNRGFREAVRETMAKEVSYFSMLEFNSSFD